MNLPFFVHQCNIEERDPDFTQRIFTLVYNEDLAILGNYINFQARGVCVLVR